MAAVIDTPLHFFVLLQPVGGPLGDGFALGAAGGGLPAEFAGEQVPKYGVHGLLAMAGDGFEDAPLFAGEWYGVREAFFYGAAAVGTRRK